MTIVMSHEDVLGDVLDTIDQSTVRGGLSPQVVVSVIDDICIGLRLTVDRLPDKLQALRSDAQQRHANHDVGFREDYVADTITMSGLWAV